MSGPSVSVCQAFLVCSIAFDIVFLVAGWAGQSGVLAPWGCDCGGSLGAS